MPVDQSWPSETLLYRALGEDFISRTRAAALLQRPEELMELAADLSIHIDAQNQQQRRG